MKKANMLPKAVKEKHIPRPAKIPSNYFTLLFFAITFLQCLYLMLSPNPFVSFTFSLVLILLTFILLQEGMLTFILLHPLSGLFPNSRH